MVAFRRRGYHLRMRLGFIVGLGLLAPLVACQFNPDGGADEPPNDVDGGFLDSGTDGGEPDDSGPDAGFLPVCGDGRVVFPEDCDDFNLVNGDGCGADCAVEDGFQCFPGPDRSQCELIPVLSVLPVTGFEGSPIDVTVIINAQSLGEVRFTYATRDGTAVAPGDYTPASGTGRIAVGETSTVVQVSTLSDLRYEPPESFAVTIGSVDGATTATDVADVTVEDVGPLTDNGLVVRYFLDEARDGANPQTVFDSGGLQFDLEVLQRGQNPSFFGGEGQGGVSWNGEGEDGRIQRDLSDVPGFRDRLDDTRSATLETVAFIVQSANASRFIHVGDDDDLGSLTLASTPTEFLFAYDRDQFVRWTQPMGVFGRRVVLTLVIDTEDDNENDRTRLYVDGERVDGPLFPIPENTDLNIPTGLALVIGNRAGGDGSIEGEIYYAAIYDEALSEDEVRANAMALTVFDDGP